MKPATRFGSSFDDGARRPLARARAEAAERVVLRDGRSATLRSIEPSDVDSLQFFFVSLSPHSRLLRFHGVVNLLPGPTVEEMVQSDGENRVVIVAEARTDDGVSCLVGEARYVLHAESGDRAEFAIAVADDWQHSGLGRALLLRLQSVARSNGLSRLDGTVLAGNEPMLQLISRLGATIAFDPFDPSTVQARWPVDCGGRSVTGATQGLDRSP